ncbi:MAG: GNAT family N-acetyltransferase, partial [Acidobacteria bacterium]|nr:GNAT family N-acetyltransferase [Acidobacteriota bacterium]
ALENGARIKVVEAVGSSIGIDTFEDLERVRNSLEPPNVDYREATVGDIPRIAEVHVESWQRSFKNVTPQEHLDAMSVENRIERFEKAFSHEASYRIFVAEESEKGIVGFADFGRSIVDKSFDAQLYAIYFLPEFQRSGFGGNLFRLCQREMVANGFGSMCLDTLEISPYRSFYKKMGGRVVGESSHSLAGREFKTLIYGWNNLKSDE